MRQGYHYNTQGVQAQLVKLGTPWTLATDGMEQLFSGGGMSNLLEPQKNKGSPPGCWPPTTFVAGVRYGTYVPHQMASSEWTVGFVFCGQLDHSCRSTSVSSDAFNRVHYEYCRLMEHFCDIDCENRLNSSVQLDHRHTLALIIEEGKQVRICC